MRARRFTVLDAWRGLAALSVVLFHVSIKGSVSDLTLFRNADLFVEFFFVLSGFVLMHAFFDGMSPGDVGPFMRRRFWRLYPLHLATLAAFIGLNVVRWVISRHGVHLITPAFSGPDAPREIVPNLLLIQAWRHGPDSFNPPAWSISIEFYVYVIFAAVLCLPRRWIGMMLVSLCVLGATLEVVGTHILTLAACRGLADFFAGTILYRLARPATAEARPSSNVWLFTAGELLAAAALVSFLSVRTLPSRYLVATPVFCFVIAVFAHERGHVSQLLKSALMQRAGELSYSIYLTHWGVLVCAMFAALMVQGRTHLQLIALLRNPTTGEMTRQFVTGSPVVGNAMLGVIVAVTIAVSMLTRRWIEVPGIAIGRRRGQRAAPQVTQATAAPPVSAADPA